ncbi:MAG: HTH domain-containing protein [Bacillota bacterium]
MSANERREKILSDICIRRNESIANLMHEYGVSRSTIIRDIQSLSVSHPIYTIQGNGGGIYVTDGYRLGKQYLKSEQQNLLEELLPTLDCEQAKIMASILKSFAFPKNK